MTRVDLCAFLEQADLTYTDSLAALNPAAQHANSSIQHANSNTSFYDPAYNTKQLHKWVRGLSGTRYHPHS